MSKKALITGINGQDGSYLAELLLDKGYEVWGTVKRNSVSETQSVRIDHIFDKLNLEYADLTDMASLVRVLQKVQPDEIYNLAAQSHVRVSFDQPIYTANATGLGTLNLLEAVRMVSPNSKIYQASSSEMFGNNIDEDVLQTDKPDDYVCSTGISHSVKDLCEYTFNNLNLNFRDYVVMDEKHLRPEELRDLKGDSSKAKKELGWRPKYTFETMINEMVSYWLDYYKESELTVGIPSEVMKTILKPRV